MTEKKTFKIGPEGYSLDHPNTAWFVVGYDTIFEEGSHWFPEDNWDVEVTFTKKRGPVESGQWRELGGGGEESVAVLLSIFGPVAGVAGGPGGIEQGGRNAGSRAPARLPQAPH